MKYLYLQISGRSLQLTPAASGRADNLLFDMPRLFALPPKLKDGKALEQATALAAFVKQCMQERALTGKLIFCLENDHLLTKEFQHLACEPKNLTAFAKLELEAVLSTDTSDYFIHTFPYGYQSAATGKFSSALFAVRGKILTQLRRAFLAEGLQIEKIVPPMGGLLRAGQMLTAGSQGDVALLDCDFYRTRLLVLHNGGPVFQRTFVGFFDDVIEIIRQDRSCTFDEAVLTAEALPLDTHGPTSLSFSAVHQIKTLMDASVEEAIRNLRMVISSERLELGCVMRCGPLVTLPNYRTYWDMQALDVPLQSISDTLQATPHQNLLPRLTAKAQQASYTPEAFFTLSGILHTDRKSDLDFLHLANRRTGSRAWRAGLLTLATCLVLAVMVTALVQSLFLHQKLAQDKQVLANPAFGQVLTLQEQKQGLQKQVKTLQENRKLLPFGASRSQEIFTQLNTQVLQKVTAQSLSFDNTTGQITVTFQIASYENYMELRRSITANGFFSLSIPFRIQQADKAWAGTLTLTPTHFTAWRAAAQKGDAANEN